MSQERLDNTEKTSVLRFAFPALLKKGFERYVKNVAGEVLTLFNANGYRLAYRAPKKKESLLQA